MEEEDKKKLKVLYSELQGYLKQAPTEKTEQGYTYMGDESVWSRLQLTPKS